MAFRVGRFAFNAATVALVAAGIGWWVATGVIPNLQPKNFAVVEPGHIYRSGELTTTAMKEVVEEHGISLVIDLGAHDRDDAAERREERTLDLLGVDRALLPLFGDGTGDPNRYVAALRLMREADGPVLVHCSAGAQRTGAAVALYRMIEEGWTLDRALAEAGQFGHDSGANPQLRAYLERWRDSIEESLKNGEAIAYDGPSPEWAQPSLRPE